MTATTTTTSTLKRIACAALAAVLAITLAPTPQQAHAATGGAYTATSVATQAVTAGAQAATSSNLKVVTTKDKKNIKVSSKNTRVYAARNKGNGDCIYTTSKSEYNALGRAGWSKLGVAWVAPKSGAKIYRLYNAKSGKHTFATASKAAKLVKSGWTREKVAFRSAAKAKGVAVYAKGTTLSTAKASGAHASGIYGVKGTWKYKRVYHKATTVRVKSTIQKAKKSVINKMTLAEIDAYIDELYAHFVDDGSLFATYETYTTDAIRASAKKVRKGLKQVKKDLHNQVYTRKYTFMSHEKLNLGDTLERISGQYEYTVNHIELNYASVINRTFPKDAYVEKRGYLQY